MIKELFQLSVVRLVIFATLFVIFFLISIYGIFFDSLLYNLFGLFFGWIFIVLFLFELFW